ncbi:hypothetical protein GCM10011395_29140 [Sphingomonas psychrolutea]|uniref:Uncharacterized protein n=1 Tax=Sphingomonas psychrolutea TaxID=1259676 RepID=A0ABQ1H2T0_9SPHN|nr:hypothetical protein GCM10011395_29140 [Sphingomonas psychrolutea]
MTDEVIAVARFVGDQLEQHEPKLAAVEHPPPARAAPAVAPAPAITAFSVTPATKAVRAETAAHHAQPARMAATTPTFYKYKHIVPFL